MSSSEVGVSGESLSCVRGMGLRLGPTEIGLMDLAEWMGAEGLVVRWLLRWLWTPAYPGV